VSSETRVNHSLAPTITGTMASWTGPSMGGRRCLTMAQSREQLDDREKGMTR